MSSPLVPVREEDFLTEDPAIRGQNYVCLSFLSPEDVIQKKEVFVFHRYLETFAKELNTLFDGLAAKYPEEKRVIQAIKETNAHMFDAKELDSHFRVFQSLQGGQLDKEYAEANNFQTSVRGIKVRGVFDTLKEAQVRCEVLKRMGDKFDIFVGQVGVWCPWSPNPEDISDQEYAETHLNTIMSKYKENLTLKDQVFEERKQKKMRDAEEENTQRKAANDLASASDADPWLDRKEAGESSS